MRRPAAILSTLLLLFLLPRLGSGGSASAAELFTLVDLRQDGVGPDDALSGVSAVAISGDGLHVYTTSPQDHALAAYSFDSGTGALTLLESFVDDAGGVFGALGLSALAVSPDGELVYAVGEVDDTLAIWSRDAGADALTFAAGLLQEDQVGGVDGLDGPVDVAVSRDWQIFVASQIDDAVVVFSRNAGSDHGFVEVERDGAGGAELLDGASAVAVSPDAKHVYVTARIDDALTVFEQSNRQLDLVAGYQNGVDGVDGLDGAVDVAVSPDGAHVYVASLVDGTVAGFSRQATTGELTFLGTYEADTGLDGATSVSVGPDGRRVLVTSRKDGALALFRRDTGTGELESLETLRHGEDGITGLLGASDAVITPDSSHVLVVAADGNTLSSWALDNCLGGDGLTDSDGDAFCDGNDLCAGDDLSGDSDSDLVCDDIDACPGFPDSEDADGDLIPDGCDLCRVNDAAGDTDGDGICDDIDP